MIDYKGANFNIMTSIRRKQERSIRNPVCHYQITFLRLMRWIPSQSTISHMIKIIATTRKKFLLFDPASFEYQSKYVKYYL